MDDSTFENRVRAIARLLWPRAIDLSGEFHDRQERDGVYITEETIHVVEATTSRKKDKAEHDIKKTVKLLNDLRKQFPHKGTKGWFVTKDAPTPDQKEVAKGTNYQVVAVSFEEFASQLVDAGQYLSARAQYRFGSIESKLLEKTGYVELPITNARGDSVPLSSIESLLRSGRQVVLLGDFGTGKSTTLRELFLRLRTGFESHQDSRFPILLNLRDHHGQDKPVEALHRHAEQVGFPAPHQLVRAWRAGYVHILLDGFDEITALGWVDRNQRLSKIRYSAMQLIRQFIHESPDQCGVAITGRLYYFDDNQRELRDALGLTRGDILELGAFSDSQVKRFLSKLGWATPIPEWFPTRPLLLGYIATSDFLSDLQTQLDNGELAADIGAGWDQLLNLICRRESHIHKTIEPSAVRGIVERLAGMARSKANSRGPFSRDDLEVAFSQVVGERPNDEALTLLQRLPGLRVVAGNDTREFIDDDLVDAARAGDVLRYILAPFDSVLNETAFDWQTTLGWIGTAVLSHSIRCAGVAPAQMGIALREASQRKLPCVAADIVTTLAELSVGYQGSEVYVQDAIIPRLTLDMEAGDLSSITFQGCILEMLELASNTVVKDLPRFDRCEITNLIGRSGAADLPSEKFNDCTVERYGSSVATTGSILQQDLPLGVRVMQTILKKTFVQRGRGRLESALYRGLDQSERRLVRTVVDLMVSEGLLEEIRPAGQLVYVPNRSLGARARRLLISPNESGDPLVRRLKELRFD